MDLLRAHLDRAPDVGKLSRAERRLLAADLHAYAEELQSAQTSAVDLGLVNLAASLLGFAITAIFPTQAVTVAIIPVMSGAYGCVALYRSRRRADVIRAIVDLVYATRLAIRR